MAAVGEADDGKLGQNTRAMRLRRTNAHIEIAGELLEQSLRHERNFGAPDALDRVLTIAHLIPGGVTSDADFEQW